MLIGHFKTTPLAYAPEAICDVINNYTEHKAYVYGWVSPVQKIQFNTAIVHQHNKDLEIFTPKLIQYHSEPDNQVTLNTDITKLVIAQYHATLPEYSGCTIVRNPINLLNPSFKPLYNNKKIRIGFSPSNIVPRSKWADKGYIETITILNGIKNKYRNLIDIDIITNVPLEECLRRKSLCNIFIDEVKTASYHRSGLESLAMGILTICSLSSEVEAVMLKVSGANKQPFVNVYYPDLFAELCSIVEKGLDYVLDEGKKSRQWMENHWHPAIIAQEYIDIYKKIEI